MPPQDSDGGPVPKKTLVQPQASIFQTPIFAPPKPQTGFGINRPVGRVPQPPATIEGRKPNFGDFLLGLAGGMFNSQAAQQELEIERQERDRAQAAREEGLGLEKERLELAKKENERRQFAEDQQQRISDLLLAENLSQSYLAPMADIHQKIKKLRAGLFTDQQISGFLTSLGPRMNDDIRFIAQGMQAKDQIAGVTKPLQQYVPEALKMYGKAREDEQKRNDVLLRQAEANLKLIDKQLAEQDAIERGEIPASQVIDVLKFSVNGLETIRNQMMGQARILLAGLDDNQKDQSLAALRTKIESLGPDALPPAIDGLAAAGLAGGLDPKVVENIKSSLTRYAALELQYEDKITSLGQRAPEFPLPIFESVAGDEGGDEPPPPPPPQSFAPFAGPETPQAEGPGFLARLAEVPQGLGRAATNFATGIGRAAGSPTSENLGAAADTLNAPKRGAARVLGRDDTTVVHELGTFLEQSITDDSRVNAQLLTQLGMAPEQFNTIANAHLNAGGNIDTLRTVFLIRILKNMGRTDAAALLEQQLASLRANPQAAPGTPRGPMPPPNLPGAPAGPLTPPSAPSLGGAPNVLGTDLGFAGLSAILNQAVASGDKDTEALARRLLKKLRSEREATIDAARRRRTAE